MPATLHEPCKWTSIIATVTLACAHQYRKSYPSGGRQSTASFRHHAKSGQVSLLQLSDVLSGASLPRHALPQETAGSRFSWRTHLLQTFSRPFEDYRPSDKPTPPATTTSVPPSSSAVPGSQERRPRGNRLCVSRPPCPPPPPPLQACAGFPPKVLTLGTRRRSAP